MAASRIPLHKWTRVEVEMLEDLTGNSPFPAVVQQYNSWAKANGHPIRSRRALEHKVYTLVDSRASYGRWVGVGDVARALGRSHQTIWEWAQQGWIRRIHAGAASAVARDDLIRLAQERPTLFGGAPRDGLLLILEDHDLVDQICRDYPAMVGGMGGRYPIRWQGKVFPSIAQAARAAHVSPSAIRLGLKEGRLVCGMRFERV